MARAITLRDISKAHGKLSPHPKSVQRQIQMKRSSVLPVEIKRQSLHAFSVAQFLTETLWSKNNWICEFEIEVRMIGQ